MLLFLLSLSLSLSLHVAHVVSLPTISGSPLLCTARPPLPNSLVNAAKPTRGGLPVAPSLTLFDCRCLPQLQMPRAPLNDIKPDFVIMPLARTHSRYGSLLLRRNCSQSGPKQKPIRTRQTGQKKIQQIIMIFICMGSMHL